MQKITFTGSRGLTLAGIVNRPVKDDPGGPCLIICHGFRGGKAGGGRAVDFAEVSLIHGAKDETVSFIQGKLLYEAAGCPKEKLFLENADHRFTSHYEDVVKATVT